jgi:hypothetical protein
VKADIAYYLLILYATVMFKPLIPIITDAWEHEFNEVAHLSLVHEKYGSHHVEKELAGNSQDDDHGKNPNSLKSEDQVPFHLGIEEYNSHASSSTFDKQFMLIKHTILLSVCINRKGPPPKFI